jgi:hypothetical protein
VGGLELEFMTFHSVGNGIMIPTDEELIFFRGVGRKPQTRSSIFLSFMMFCDLYNAFVIIRQCLQLKMSGPDQGFSWITAEGSRPVVQPGP